MSFAFLFPGQGSQTIGMLSELANQYPEIQQTFNEASEILNEDLWQIAQIGPAELLNQTTNTQPILLTAGTAIWRVWQKQTESQPQFLSGHSLGEYTALVAASVLTFADALKLVRIRGELMQEAVPQGVGAMAAIVGLDEKIIETICRDASNNNEIVSPANYNTPEQIVLAGHLNAVQRAMQLAEQQEARLVKQLPMSVPSHCALLKNAAEKLLENMSQINFAKPNIAVINNVDVANETNADAIKNALYRQLYSPVKWATVINHLQQHGVKYFIESGPQKVLTGLNKRNAAECFSIAINSSEDLIKAINQINE